MGIKTEDMYNRIPPKQVTRGVEWFGILDEFDPTGLSENYINECARRNRAYTSYMIEPAEPVEKRMELLDFSISMDRKELEKWVSRMDDEGLVPSYYNHARVTLIKLIGSKGAQEYNRREYEELGEEGRARQIEIYKKWEEGNRERWEKIEEVAHSMPEPASVHEKIVIIRKGFRGSNGKYMTQRDFARFLEYPISRYAEAESRTDFGMIELPVEDELIDLLVSKCHANPYWIYDGECEAEEAILDETANIVRIGAAPSVYAAPEVILRWIKEGKPRKTNWEDGIPDRHNGLRLL